MDHELRWTHGGAGPQLFIHDFALLGLSKLVTGSDQKVVEQWYSQYERHINRLELACRVKCGVEVP